MKQIQRKQSGFTLVEIAIVLVIIGLLLGGVLKGQSMIDNAKVKSYTQEFSSVSTMLYAYQDKYKSLPGDDANVALHLGGLATGATAGAATTGDGSYDTGNWVGLTVAPAAANESSLYWQHVRLAGLANGSVILGDANNATGGILGITSVSSVNRVTSPANTSGTFVTCSSGITGRLATILDIAMDDGIGNSGNMFGSPEAAGPIVAAVASAVYTPAATFTVCQTF